MHGGIFFVSGLVGLLLGGGNLFIGFVFLAVGAVRPVDVPRLPAQPSPQGVQLVAARHAAADVGSLAAGLSLAQSIDTIVREGTEPIASEFRRVLVETRLGVSLEDALEGVAERFDSKDFDWVVMAIKIQRQVGGNLAELLDTVAATMREREYMRRQVAALAAEGKLSAMGAGRAPAALHALPAVTNRDYVMRACSPSRWAGDAGRRRHHPAWGSSG